MSTSVPSSHDGHVRPAATTTADRPADAGRPRRGSAGGSLARIAVMTALMAVLGLVPPIAVAGVPAPIVLQNIAVILAGVILGPWRGAASMALFAGLVALGLPLLSGVVMVYFCGVLGFVGIAGMEFGAAVLSMAPFVPGDLIKLVVAVILIVGLWKAYPRAFR